MREETRVKDGVERRQVDNWSGRAAVSSLLKGNQEIITDGLEPPHIREGTPWDYNIITVFIVARCFSFVRGRFL